MKPSTFTKFYLHALAVDHVDIYIALSDVFGHKHPYAAAATVSKRLFEHKTLKAIGPDIIYATVIANGAEQEQQQQHENDKERRDKDGYKQKSKSEKGLMMVRMMRDEDGKGLEDKVEVNTSAETKDLKSTEPLIDERSRSDVHDYGSSRGEVSEQKLLSNTDSGGLQAPFWVQCRGENATNDHRCERNTDSPSKLCGIHDPDVPKCSFETWEGDSCRNPRVLGELFGIHSPFVLKCSSKTQEGDDCRNLRTHGQFCEVHSPDTVKCSSKTKEGLPCKKPITRGIFCDIHSPDTVKCKAIARSTGVRCRNLPKPRRNGYCKYH